MEEPPAELVVASAVLPVAVNRQAGHAGHQEVYPVMDSLLVQSLDLPLAVAEGVELVW